MALSSRRRVSVLPNIAIPAMERGDAWQWILTLNSAPSEVIGSIGLTKQRQGLMTEACEVVTEYWFSTPKFPVLRVPKAVANTASRRIWEKEGMRVVAVEERD